MPIRVTINGQSWLTEDLTLDECAQIEQETGESWLTVLTAPLKSAVVGRAIIKPFLVRQHGTEEGVKRAGALTLKQMTEAFEVVEDDRPKTYENGVPVVDPKGATGEPTTISSS